MLPLLHFNNVSGIISWNLTKYTDYVVSCYLQYSVSKMLRILLRHNQRDKFKGIYTYGYTFVGRSQWPRCLRRWSAAARLQGLRVRIPPAAWMSVCCECCVLPGKGLCDGPITRPEESYWVWCDWVWSWSLDKERRPWSGLVSKSHRKKIQL